MIINKKIKEFIIEVAAETVKHNNTPNTQRKYIRKLYHFFDKQLNEEEKIFLLTYFLEQIHYKNLMTDPDNMIHMHNIKMRTASLIFFWIVITIFIVSVLIIPNSPLGFILNIVDQFFKIVTAV